jgi:formylglycine-generating enzyme required for sulfatase activity
VEKRLKFARTIAERTVTGAEASLRWREAIASIRDVQQCPRYAGLVLTSQLGLVPLGRDEDSGLWEFADLQTGEPAVRGEDGKLVVSGEMGLVFVLIPGGTFWMGAQRIDPTGNNYDPQANGNESPVHEVTLSPYLLSKYEMTQGQWLRISGHNPSAYGPCSPYNLQHDLTHPVDQVTWTGCMELLGWLGLELPTEAQWEVGCRAGTDTPWSTGRERESLRGRVNLADRTAKLGGGTWPGIQDWPDLEDGWVIHATVGTFAANPYGLNEVHGNVCEWCRDGYNMYSADKRLDPLTPWIGLAERVVRGGSFTVNAAASRSASRNYGTPGTQTTDLGLRPARELTTR